jgi:glutathione-regulated potassium-efflux system protein KefB
VKLISDVENVLHFAELGVVLLLFLIGLELQPSRLWQMRKTVFGVGTAQVVGTGAVIALLAMALGLGWRPALIAGVGLALSSTAIALQLLAEKNELATDYGRTAFGILLFQDLAVIPVLALLPILGDGGSAQSAEPGWIATLKVIGVLVGVVLVGRFVIRPVFRLVASIHSQELFTATALLIVLGTALIVSKVGMSMALGAFLAGVLLADSEYRHELKADIEPFKGLLLGLFFIAVGMSVNLGLIAARPVVVVALVLGFVAVKTLAIFVIGKISLKDNEPALSLGVAISQGGEFAFVLFGLAVTFRVMDRATSELLVVVVSLSMATTPALLVLHDRVIRPRLGRKSGTREYDVAPDEDSPVIIAGFGRVGQVVGRILRAKRVRFTALDASPEHIDFIKRFGNKVFLWRRRAARSSTRRASRQGQGVRARDRRRRGVGARRRDGAAALPAPHDRRARAQPPARVSPAQPRDQARHPRDLRRQPRAHRRRPPGARLGLYRRAHGGGALPRARRAAPHGELSLPQRRKEARRDGDAGARRARVAVRERRREAEPGRVAKTDSRC